MSSKDDVMPATDPAWITVNATKARYSIGHTTLYKILAEGGIEARKYGDKTLISRQSADRYFESLPKFKAVA